MDNSLEKKKRKNTELSFEYSKYFIKQWSQYTPDIKRIILNKFRIIRINPYRYPSLFNYRCVFKTNISVEDKYSRLIYSVHNPTKGIIKILGVFSRK